MKTCPSCAEEVKEAANICRFCGHDFSLGGILQPNISIPDKPNSFSDCLQTGAGCLVAVLLILFVLFQCTSTGDEMTSVNYAAGGDSSGPAAKKLDQDTLNGCAEAIEDAKASGIVRKQSTAGTIYIDDATWRMMNVDDKNALLSLVACNTYGVKASDLELGDGVTAVGYKSGKTLATLTSAGIDFK